MKKKILLATLTIIFSLAVSISFTFANTNNGAMDVVNGVRNVVGGAENGIEDAAKGITSGIRNGTGAVENAAGNTAGAIRDGVANGTDNQRNSAMGVMTDNNGSNYTATRTSANDGGTFAGMNSTMWTWVVLALVAFAIIALIWAYIRQDNYRNQDDNNL